MLLAIATAATRYGPSILIAYTNCLGGVLKTAADLLLAAARRESQPAARRWRATSPDHLSSSDAHARRLVPQPDGRFCSCFISYATEDCQFAEKLYEDLRKHGVHCWFAPRDVRGGKKLHEEILQAIRASDRLLLIVSDHSMKSEWVRAEVAFASEIQKKERRDVLFPVGLVPYTRVRRWKSSDAGFSKDTAREIRDYFIPDFTNWQNQRLYRKALVALLAGLELNNAGRP
jgi:hypothetical protein